MWNLFGWVNDFFSNLSWQYGSDNFLESDIKSHILTFLRKYGNLVFTFLITISVILLIITKFHLIISLPFLRDIFNGSVEWNLLYTSFSLASIAKSVIILFGSILLISEIKSQEDGIIETITLTEKINHRCKMLLSSKWQSLILLIVWILFGFNWIFGFIILQSLVFGLFEQNILMQMIVGWKKISDELTRRYPSRRIFAILIVFIVPSLFMWLVQSLIIRTASIELDILIRFFVILIQTTFTVGLTSLHRFLIRKFMSK